MLEAKQSLDMSGFLARFYSNVFRGSNGRPYLVDTSSNGTWVNGEQVKLLSLIGKSL